MINIRKLESDLWAFVDLLWSVKSLHHIDAARRYSA